MKIFPTRNYKIEMNGNADHSFELLKSNTQISSDLSSQLTGKDFIGQVSDNKFRIISSEMGIGGFTVFEGNFTNNIVDIFVQVNKPFKNLIFIIFLVGFAGICESFFRDISVRSLRLIFPLIILIVLIRFVIIGLFFKISSNLTLKKLRNILK
jgi:hypothetical protein